MLTSFMQLRVYDCSFVCCASFQEDVKRLSAFSHGKIPDQSAFREMDSVVTPLKVSEADRRKQRNREQQIARDAIRRYKQMYELYLRDNNLEVRELLGTKLAYMDFLTFMNYRLPVGGLYGIALPRHPSVVVSQAIQEKRLEPWVKNCLVIERLGSGKSFPVGDGYYQTSRCCYVSGVQFLNTKDTPSRIKELESHLRSVLETASLPAEDVFLVQCRIHKSELKCDPGMLPLGTYPVELSGTCAFKSVRRAKKALQVLIQEGSRGKYKFTARCSYDRTMIEFKMPNISQASLASLFDAVPLEAAKKAREYVAKHGPIPLELYFFFDAQDIETFLKVFVFDGKQLIFLCYLSDVAEWAVWEGPESRWRHYSYHIEGAIKKIIGTVGVGPFDLPVEYKSGGILSDWQGLGALFSVPGGASPDRDVKASGPISVRCLCT